MVEVELLLKGGLIEKEETEICLDISIKLELAD